MNLDWILCTRCHKPKPEELFYKEDGDLFKTCAECREYERNRKRRYERKNNPDPVERYHCPSCEMRPKCEVRVEWKMPVLCEVEVWGVDMFFFEQVPQQVRLEVLNE